MLYGIAVSDLTSLISKRTLYYTKDASSNYSAVKFDRKDGNLYYDRNVDHEFNDKSCIYCGASKIEFNRSNDKEKKALESYGKNLGLAFQIADDALDYYAKEKLFGKEIGKDFFEGKVTLPLISIFQKGNDKEKKFLAEIMKKENRTDEDFGETLSLINKYKAVEATFKKAEFFVNVSFDALAIFPETEDKRILQNLTSFSLNRSF